MKNLNKEFLNLAKNIPQGVTPGFQLQVYKKGEKCLDVEWGKTFKYYDLASLTKILFTVPWMMKAVEEGRVNLNQALNTYVPWSPCAARVKDVLSHRAGNIWWKPFYKELSLKESNEYKKNELKALLRDLAPENKPQKSVYSDIDFFLLGFLLENVFEKSLEALWDEFHLKALNQVDMFFHKNNQPKHKINQYAPTEKDPWRKKILQGEVHDENAWALGGVAPHAGLFADIHSVAAWGLWLRKALLGEDEWLKVKTVQPFLKRAMPETQGDWALGFMLPTQGSASCGKYFSPTSIGHTGFTGTSFWFDLKKDIFIILLSNRVHPTRKNEEFRKLRPQIHDWVMEILD